MCGVLPTKTELSKLSRAGVGASGIYASIFLVIAQVARLELRPVLFGAIEAVFAFSSVVGSLLGASKYCHANTLLTFDSS